MTLYQLSHDELLTTGPLTLENAAQPPIQEAMT